MGLGHSKIELWPTVPEYERFYGFTNYGATCYVNAVLQCLFHNQTLRALLLEAPTPDPEDKKANPLPPIVGALFAKILAQRSVQGHLGTKPVLEQLRRISSVFEDRTEHQDAQEFLNMVLDDVEGVGGELTSSITCRGCGTTTTTKEKFITFPLALNHENESLKHILQGVEKEKEVLKGGNRFFCDKCEGLQVADKVSWISEMPDVLLLHLKRFRYNEERGTMSKVPYRIPFPIHLKIKEEFFELSSLVVHSGRSLHRGHYYAVAQSYGEWLLINDEELTRIDHDDLDRFYHGGYLLVYEREEEAGGRRSCTNKKTYK